MSDYTIKVVTANLAG